MREGATFSSVVSVFHCVHLEGIWGIPSLCLGGGGLVLNMEKEIEDLITGNRWKQAYEVSVRSLPDFLAASLNV